MTRFLTVADVAASLQVSEKTVRRLILRGELKASRVGRSIRIAPEDADRAARRRRVAGVAYSMVSGSEASH